MNVEPGMLGAMAGITSLVFRVLQEELIRMYPQKYPQINTLENYKIKSRFVSQFRPHITPCVCESSPRMWVNHETKSLPILIRPNFPAYVDQPQASRLLTVSVSKLPRIRGLTSYGIHQSFHRHKANLKVHQQFSPHARSLW